MRCLDVFRCRFSPPMEPRGEGGDLYVLPAVAFGLASNGCQAVGEAMHDAAAAAAACAWRWATHKAEARNDGGAREKWTLGACPRPDSEYSLWTTDTVQAPCGRIRYAAVLFARAAVHRP